MSNQLATRNNTSIFASNDEVIYELAKKKATALSKSDMVPQQYQDNIPNCLVALEISNRIGIGPFEVMQNMNVIQGRPAWSSAYIIAALNSCGRFEPIRFEYEDLGKKTISYQKTEWSGGNRSSKTLKETVEDKRCRVVTKGLNNGEEYKGSWVSIELAVKEGWYSKNGSKWQTMPDQMLMYRAASFFSRVYAPDVIIGMQSVDEVQDATIITTHAPANAEIKKETVNLDADDIDSEEIDEDAIENLNEELDESIDSEEIEDDLDDDVQEETTEQKEVIPDQPPIPDEEEELD